MDISAWLTGFGLERYAQQFADNEIDEKTLLDLTDADLKELGVAALGHRKKLLAAIAELVNVKGKIESTIPPSAVEGSHRQVTVLFADISGFTKRSSELGAEAAHDLLNRYFGVVDKIVEGYGGTIDKHMGDNVMAVFGAPIAHTDDSQRAVRAACDIHESVSALGNGASGKLQVHIGIASGQVVASGTGSDAHREYTITGDSVNLASRLQNVARAGETCISDTVQRAVAKIVTCEAMDEIAIKGFVQPVRVWRLVGLQSESSERDSTPFVGRRSESGQFASILSNCRETENGQTIYIRGEAGIGKTRLITELRRLAELQGYTCHTGLVLDFGVARGQDAIRSIVRSLLNIPAGSSTEVHVAAADKAVADGRLGLDDRIFLNDLLGIPQSSELSAVYDTMDNATRNHGKRLAVVRLVQTSSTTRPVLVIVEDIHWASSIELTHLATLAAAVNDFPALLVMTSRFEGDPIDQAWRSAVGRSPFTTIDLAPLREAEALELAAGFFDAGNRFALTCVERAGGNPLFLDQLLRSAQEIGRDEVPPSVQSLVQARVDRLGHVDRLALQAASVIGQRFPPDSVRHLIENPNYSFEKLLSNSLIRPEGDAFLFAHALVRDGVYSSLLTARRNDLHRRAADWFRDLDPMLRAEHLDRAEDPAAADAYLDAAKTEVDQFHFERAGALAKRGLEVARQLTTRYALTCLHGNILRELGETDKSIEAFERSLESSVNDSERLVAWIGQAEGMRLADRIDDALAVLDKAELIASADGRLDHLAQIHFLRGNLYFPLGNIDGCLEQHELALRFARNAGSAEGEARALGGLGDAHYQRGRMITAHKHFRACVELSRKNGFGRIEVANLYMIGSSIRYVNELKNGVKIAVDTIEAASRVGHRRAELIGRVVAFNLLVEMADEDGAHLHMDEAETLVERLGARRFEPQVLIHRATLLRYRARKDEGLALCRRAVAISRETGAGFVGPWACGELAANTQDPIGRRQALSDGENMLAAGAVSHSHFHFYASAIDACLDGGAWDEVDRYATALEKFTQPEPLPWCDFVIARGRALSRHGRGLRDEATILQLQQLQNEAARVGLRLALRAIDAALVGTS